MNELEAAIKEVEELKKSADANVEEGDPRSRLSREMAKAQAKENLPAAEDKLREVLGKHIVYVLPAGTPQEQEKFAQIAEEEADTFTVDASRIYRTIAARAYEMVGPQGHFVINNAVDTVSIIREEARKYGITTPFVGAFDTEFYVHGVDELEKIVYLEIDKLWGTALTKAYVQDEAYKAVLASGYKYGVVGVVVIGTVEHDRASLVDSLSSKDTFVVPITSKPTPENVVKTFKQLQSSIKSKREE